MSNTETTTVGRPYRTRKGAENFAANLPAGRDDYWNGSERVPVHVQFDVTPEADGFVVVRTVTHLND